MFSIEEKPCFGGEIIVLLTASCKCEYNVPDYLLKWHMIRVKWDEKLLHISALLASVCAIKIIVWNT